jgi:uncharacterized protein YjbI with pentapeptide repeats
LSRARCAGGAFVGCDLSASWFDGADFSGATLLGSDLTGLDPSAVTLRGTTVDERQAVALIEAMGLVVVPA